MSNKSSHKELPNAPQPNSEKGLRNYQEGQSFESRVVELYRLLRYDVEHGRIFSGRQVDLFLTGRFGDLTVHRAIECKAGPVKAEHIDSFIAKLRLVQREHPTVQGTIVSGVSFTPAITSQAAQEGIQLTLYRDLEAQLLDGHTYVKNIIMECESNERYPMRLYIEPFIGYEPNGKAIPASNVLDEWLQDSQWNQFTLLGDVGTGKSFLSRMLAYKLAKNFLSQPLEKPVPILIDLRNADRQFSLEGLILTHLAQNGLGRVSFEVFLHALSQGHVVLILDGFDEMAARVTPQVTNRNFHELARCVQDYAKVLLTCRTHYFRSRTEEEEVVLGSSQDYGSETARDLYWELISRKGFRIAYLRPFEVPQIEEYVQRAKPSQAKMALHRIRNTYNLMELSQRPMLLEMIVKSIDKLTAEEIGPVTLYMVYTDAWIHRDQWRDVLSPQAKLSFLMALAHSLWHEDAPSIHCTKLIEYLQQELATQIQNPQQLLEIDNEIRTASFLTRDDMGNYGFAHKSYAEFFLARYLSLELNNGRLDCLHTRRLSKEIISFLRCMVDMQRVKPLLEDILQNSYRSRSSENALACLYGFQREIFLSTQQSSQKGEDLKLVVSLPSTLRLSGAQLDQMSLEGIALKDADLTNANLSQAILTRADLTAAIIKGADLEKADLTYAILSSADLSGAVLSGANLGNADLTNAIFKDANLSEAYLLNTSYAGTLFTGAILARAVLPDGLSAILGRITDEVAIKRTILTGGDFPVPEYQATIERLYPFMLKVARAVSLRSDYDAQDLAQEAVIALLNPKSLKKFNRLTEAQQRSLVRDFITNRATDIRSQHSREKVFSDFGTVELEFGDISDYIKLMPDSDPGAEANLITGEIEKEMENAISELEKFLPPQFWRILKARYLDDDRLIDIAAKESLSISTVHRYLNKAGEIARRHFRTSSKLQGVIGDGGGERS